MRRVRLGLLIVTLLSLISFTSAQKPETKKAVVTRSPIVREFNPAFAGRPEGEIELREHQLSDALRTKNGDEVGRILGERVLISGILGERKALIFLFTSLNENKYFSIEKSEMRIEVYGDMAVSTGVQKSDIDLENGSRFSQTNFINTWKRIDGIWRCVAMGS